MTETPSMDDVRSPLPRLPMTKALVTLLADVTKKPWDIRRIPTIEKTEGGKSEPVRVKAPFGILYPQWVQLSGPMWADPEADATWHYQATYSALRGDQAEWGFDRVVAGISGRRADQSFVFPLEVDGMSVMNRWITDADAPDPDARAEIVSSVVRFAVSVTPDR